MFTVEQRSSIGLLFKRPITEEIALQVGSVDEFKMLEVMQGVWVGFEQDQAMTGEEHGRLEYRLILNMGIFIEEHDLGTLYPGDTDFVLAGTPRNILIQRKPDIAFVARANERPTSGFLYQAPDLAVEIVSPSQTAEEMIAKVEEYLFYGTQEVWIVLPKLKQIELRFANGETRTYRLDDIIRASRVLPGLELSLAKVFK